MRTGGWKHGSWDLCVCVCGGGGGGGGGYVCVVFFLFSVGS